MKVRDPQNHYKELAAALDQAIEGLVAARKLLALVAGPPPRRRTQRSSTSSSRRLVARSAAPMRAASANPFEQAFREGVPLQPRATEELSASVHEAAVVLGIGEEQVRRLLREGGLVGIPYGGRRGWRIPRRYLEDFAAERRQAKERELQPA